MLTTSTGPNPVHRTAVPPCRGSAEQKKVANWTHELRIRFYVSVLFIQDICRLPYYECPTNRTLDQHSRYCRHSTNAVPTYRHREDFAHCFALHSFSCLFGLPCGLHNKCQIQFSGVRPGVRINYLGKLHICDAHAPAERPESGEPQAATCLVPTS